MGYDFNGYVRHLYYKYEDNMTEYEKDLCWNCCGLEEVEHLFTDGEKAELSKLWNEEVSYYGYEVGCGYDY